MVKDPLINTDIMILPVITEFMDANLSFFARQRYVFIHSDMIEANSKVKGYYQGL